MQKLAISVVISAALHIYVQQVSCYAIIPVLRPKNLNDSHYGLIFATEALVNFDNVVCLVCHMTIQMCSDISCGHQKQMSFSYNIKLVQVAFDIFTS